MDSLAHDLRHALRKLRKSPGFALIAILTLALGIGANTAIFSVVNAVLLRPLPFAEESRLVAIESWTERGGGAFSALDFRDVREQNRVFTDVVMVDANEFTLMGNGESERVDGAHVTAEFFSLFGVTPQHGRGFRSGEDQPGQSRVAVLSHGLWKRRYGGDPALVGQAIRIDGEPYTVVGIAGSEMKFPSTAQLWVPFTWEGDLVTESNRGAHFASVYARLKPNVSVAQAETDVKAIMKRLEAEYPASNTGWSAEVVGLRAELVDDVRTALLVLLGAVGLVLLIACANLSNLLLARAASREGEFSLRLALGAERKRLIRQLMVESGVLAIAGGAVGVLLAVWGLEFLKQLGPAEIPRLDEVGIDGTVLVFTLILAIATALLFGLVPALQSSRVDLSRPLREMGRSGRAGSRNGTRHLLIVSEVALAVMLLVAAGLLLRSFVRLQQIDPGFRSENVLAVNVALPESSYEWGSEASGDFYEQLLERVRSMPDVRAAGASFLLPLSGSSMISSLQDLSLPEADPGSEWLAQVRIVMPGYFETMQIPLKSGRFLMQEDMAAGARNVLISEEAARRYWPDEDPVGKTVEVGVSFGNGSFGGTIVGVVGAVRHQSMSDEPFPEVYIPFVQARGNDMTLLVRTGGDPTNLASAIRSEVEALDAEVPVSEIRTMDAVLGKAVAEPRFYAMLIAIFAGLALLLAAIGIYGVVANAVSHRTQEFGIRMALGAAPTSVIGLVVKQYLRLTAGGLVIGGALSFVAGRFLSGMLFGVESSDPVTLVGVALLLSAVALLACTIPARRATRIDPIVALKHE